jgi:DNA-binding MarR family transcriptional regulator
MDPATIFGVVGRLMRRGLVTQRADSGDARLTLIELTADGRDLIRRAKSVGAEVSRRTLAPLSAAEAQTLLALLARLE